MELRYNSRLRNLNRLSRWQGRAFSCLLRKPRHSKCFLRFKFDALVPLSVYIAFKDYCEFVLVTVRSSFTRHDIFWKNECFEWFEQSWLQDGERWPAGAIGGEAAQHHAFGSDNRRLPRRTNTLCKVSLFTFYTTSSHANFLTCHLKLLFFLFYNFSTQVYPPLFTIYKLSMLSQFLVEIY